MNDATILKEKKWIYLIFLTISILFSIFFSIPANAAVGDLILDTEIFFLYDEPEWKNTLCTTLLKEGYSLSLDDVYSDQTIASLTIYKNEEIVKKVIVNRGDYFYYNKTIGGREYTIIESKVVIYLGTPRNIAKLKPFYQYSDGATIIEPDFLSAILNPNTTEAPSEEWNRTFGGIYDDNLRSVQQTSDNGYILAGAINSLNPNGQPKYLVNGWVIKVDVNGNEQWNKTFKDFSSILFVSHFHDGSYISVGRKSSSTVLVKNDVNGNQLWKKSIFDYPQSIGYQSIQQTSDGGYIFAGKSYVARGTDAMLLKTNSHGIRQWSKTFGLDGFSTTSSVRETPDGGYILTGYIWWNENPRPREVWLLKADSNGTEQWNMTFGGAGQDFVNSVQNTLDGGYILVGRTGSYRTSDAWLLKTDANGNEQWNKTFGLDGFDCVYSVVQTSDGGYVLAGTIDTAKNPDFKGQILYTDNDFWLFKTDANGNLEWSKTIGGLKSDEAKFVQLTSDGGYVIAGNTRSYGSGSSDIWLVKIGGMKVDTTQSQVIISDNNVSVNNVSVNNVTNNIKTSPGKSIPGFEFFGVVFSVLIILLSRKRIL